MPLDSRIAMSYRMPQIEGPLDQYRNLAQLQQMMQQNQMGRMQMEEARRQQAEQEQLKSLMAQTGGDPEKAISTLLSVGTPKSVEMAARLRTLIPKPEGAFSKPDIKDFTPESVRTFMQSKNPADLVRAQPQDKEFAPPEIMRLQAAWEKAPPGPIRDQLARRIDVLNKDPSTRIYHNTPAPVTALVMQDTTSPTGWSYVDGRTQKIISKGAPPPAGARNASADPTIPPSAPEGVTAVPAGVQGAAGTGGSGFFGGIANTVADAVGRPMPYPNVETASQALKNLQVQTMTVAQDSVPGRPSNYLMQQLKQLSVTPNSLLMADQRSKTRLEQTRAMLQTEVARMQREVLERPNQYTAAQLSKTRNSFGQLRQLVGEYDRVISSFGGTAAASDVMNQADEILKRGKKP